MYRSKIKSLLSKINFQLGRNPKVERRKDWRNFIPNHYKSVIIITADFELAWAWRYAKEGEDAYELAMEKAQLERDNIPTILELCDHYEIPITWATVGHLFLDSCEKQNDKAHSEISKVNPYKGPYWDFNGNDWFEYDPCTDYKTDPEWYAPDLVKMILDAKVEHEIGCHTFSHIDCRDEICPPALFESELHACKKAAKEFGIELESFVHPGHTTGHLDKLAESGFTSFQSDPGNILGCPIRHQNGLWELKRTYEFSYRKEWSVDYHIYRYKKLIDRAIKSHTVCNFWFHPSFEKSFVDMILPEIFKHINNKLGEIRAVTVDDYIRWLGDFGG